MDNNNIETLLDALEKRFEAIQADADNTASEFETKLEKAKEKLSVATEKMDDASRADDLKAYQEAFREVQDLTAEVEFYTTRIDAKRTKALLKPEECAEIIDDVQTAYRAMELKHAKIILPLLTQLRDVCMSEAPVINRANSLLYTLMFEIMKSEHNASGSNIKQIKTSLPTLEIGRELTPSSSNFKLATWFTMIESAVNDESDPNKGNAKDGERA